MWAICWNGPAQGEVAEVNVQQSTLEVCDLAEHGRHMYRRTGWCNGPGGRGHYIARFQWTKTLVV